MSRQVGGRTVTGEAGPSSFAYGSPLVLPAADLPTRQVGQWAMVWRRFKRHRLALVGAWVGVGMALLAVVGPLLAPPFVHPDQFGNIPLWAYHRANHPPQLWPWNPALFMGTDAIGNPVLTYILVGAQPILEVGFFGSLLASLLGILVGGISGYLGGAVDALLMRLVDAVLAVPFLLLLVLLIQYLTDRSVLTYVALFGLVGWPGVARLVRGYVLSLREREFALAARALGVSPWGVIGRHLLPNALDVVVVSFTLNVAIFMVTEATLDYLRSGVTAVTWGQLLTQANLLDNYWWQYAFPSLALLLAVLAVNFLGDGLRDAFDVTSQTAPFADMTTSEQPGRAGPLRRAVVPLGEGMGWAWRRLELLLALPGQLAHVSRLAQSPGPSHIPRVLRAPSGRMEPAQHLAGDILARSPSTFPGRVLLARARRWLEVTRALECRYASLPVLFRLAPMAAAFLLLSTVFLYSHSPLRYSPHYAPPTLYAQTEGEYQYAAWPRRRGRWDIFALDNSGRVTYRRVDPQGRTVLDQVLTTTFGSDQLSMAKSGGRTLGAWVGDQGQIVYVASLGRHGSRPVALTPPGGAAEHPYVVPVTGGFDVLFGWQKQGRSTYDLYLASLPLGFAHPVVSRLTRSGNYALYPRGIVDGGGALVLLYLEQTDPDHGYWEVVFQRFNRRGRPLVRPQPLGQISYVAQRADGSLNPNVIPAQWALDLKRASDGSVWGAWEYGDDTVSRQGVTGMNTLAIAHWSRSGHLLLPPTVVDPGVDASTEAIALALQRSGGQLYTIQFGAVVPYLQSIGFSASGQPLPPERVNYDGGAKLANPFARSVGGRPAVLWERIRVGGATLEGTDFHPAQPPDLLTRLGLNIGNLWGNLALILFGSLGAGIALTLVNVFLLLPLIPVWLVVRRLAAAALRWPLYLAGIFVLLAWVFALHASLPSYVLVLPSLVSAPLGVLDAWLAVGGAVFVSGWAGAFLLHRQESAVRATAMALLGLYFVTIMYAVLYIQSQVNQI